MKREEMKDEKISRILDCSFKLFIKQGIRNTSIQDIVNMADIGKGTFYFYFKDKYEVRDILISQKSNELFNNAFKKLDSQNFSYLSEKIIFIIDNVIDELVKAPELLKFISKNLSYGIYKNAINELLKDNENLISELFENGIKKNNEKLKNPQIMLSIIIELVGSTCYNSILYAQPLPIKDFKPFLYNSIEIIIENENS